MRQTAGKELTNETIFSFPYGGIQPAESVRLSERKPVLCPRSNLSIKVPSSDLKGAWGSLFSSATQKAPKPVTAPKEDNVRRTGTKNDRRCGGIVRGAAS